MFGLLALIVVVEIAALRYRFLTNGFRRLGLSQWGVGTLLAASFLCSVVNIPVMTVGADHALYGAASRDTLVALNLGGAIIPLILCLYIAIRFPRSLPIALLATILVTVGVHLFAYPTPGAIVVPALLPPLFATIAALLTGVLRTGQPQDRFVSAYLGGTLGTLVGADVLNMDKFGSLGSPPVAAIGGAGISDGIFLAGFVGVLFVSLIPHHTQRAFRCADD